MNYGFVIDNRKCIGCHACTVACKAEHEVPIGVNRTWVKYIEKGTFPNTTRHFSVLRCNHCADAPCVEICPVSALYKRKDGIVDFDNRRCIGCKACMQACPYDALYIDPETHTAAKCNYCAHRIDIGLEPACVNVCPEHAIVSGDLDDPTAEIAQLVAREQVTVRKPEKGTAPQLFYIDGDRVSLDASATPQSDSYIWSGQTGGVGHFARYADRRQAQGRAKATGGTTADSAARQTDRRVYDAPSKGVLWGWEVSAYVWTKALAAGSFLVPFVIRTAWGLPAEGMWNWLDLAFAFLFLALTGVLLVKDLDQPSRFLYVMLRPQWKSWLVRGAYVLAAYGALLTLSVLGRFLQAAWLPAIEWLAALGACAAAVYTAFLFAQAKGRDFWQSPVLGIQMLLHAVVGGSSLIVISVILGPPPSGWGLAGRWILLGSLLVHLMVVLIEFLTPHATKDARTAAQILTRGSLRREFWGGFLLVGHVLPILMTVAGGFDALMIAPVFALAGMLMGQHLWVRAPQLIPLS